MSDIEQQARDMDHEIIQSQQARIEALEAEVEEWKATAVDADWNLQNHIAVSQRREPIPMPQEVVSFAEKILEPKRMKIRHLIKENDFQSTLIQELQAKLEAAEEVVRYYWEDYSGAEPSISIMQMMCATYLGIMSEQALSKDK